MKRINRFNILNIITYLLLLALPYYLFAGKLFIGGDDTRLMYSYPFEFLKNFIFFSWTNTSSMGINAANQHLLPFLSIWSVSDLLINNKIILSYLAFSLPLILGFAYFKKFVKELFDLKNSNEVELYIGSLFYVLSPIIIINQLFIFLTTVWLLGFVPIVGYYYLKYLKSSNFLYIYISIIFCIVFSFVSLSIPWISGLMLPALVGIPVLVLLSKKKEILLVLKRTTIFFLLLLLSQSYWLFGFFSPFLVQDKNSYAIKFTSKVFLDTFTPTVLATAKGYIIYPLLNLFHRQIAFDFGWKLKDIFINFYDTTFIFGLLFILILIIGIINYKKYLGKTNRKIYLFILTSFITSLYFFTVNIGPLKDLFILLRYVPGFVMFRNFYDKFAPGYVFFYSILITISLVMIKKKFASKSKWFNLVILFIIILNFSTVKSTVNAPLWTTSNIYKTINIPKEYLHFMNKVGEKISSTNNILSIPFGAASYTVIKDENSDNAYVGTSPVKIFSGVNDISGDFSFNFSKEIDLIDKIIIDRKYEELNKIIYTHNINYVLVTKNIPNQVLKSYIFSSKTLKKQDTEFLNAITDKKILTSENGNYELYTTKNKNNLLESQNLYFQKINATKYILYLKNIKDSQELKFNDTFHGDWKLYLQKNPNLKFCTNKIFLINNTTECKSNFSFFDLSELPYLWNKPIFNSSHGMINEFSNIWTVDPSYVKKNFSRDYYTINKDGSVNIKLVLYFKQQLYLYYGLIISFIAVALSTTYLIITLLKKHEKYE